MFFRKNKNENEAPEDFVLFSDAEQQTDDNSLQEDAVSEELQNTACINTSEIVESLEASDSDDDDDSKKLGLFTRISQFASSHKIQTVSLCVILIAAIIAGAGYGAVQAANPLRKYVQYAASKENIVSTLEAEGELASGDKYEIVSLVSGKITKSEFEVGDEVSAGDVLYELDDTEAKLNLERAKNELNKANDPSATSSSSDTGRIIASEAGTVESISVKQGSTVNAGSQIGIIKKSDGSTSPIISYVSGTVSIVSVSAGRSVSSGQLIAIVKLGGSTQSQASSTYDKKSSEIDVQAAEKQLEAYTVKSPIDGIVIEKNNKAGDNVGDANSYKPMMVILDTSKLSMTFTVDGSRIAEVKKGQPVTVTSDSVPDTKFSGEVSNVGLEGKNDGNGNIVFDVTVSVSEPDGLKSGMKAKAKIILDTANSSTAVPQDALLKSDGQNALVLVKNDETTTDKDIGDSLDNQLEHPDIKVPKGCTLVSVKYGISDGTNVQIISGVKVGEVIVYNPKADYGEFVKSTSKTDSSKKSDDSEDYDKSDDDIEKELEEKMDDIFGNANI